MKSGEFGGRAGEIKGLKYVKQREGWTKIPLQRQENEGNRRIYWSKIFHLLFQTEIKLDPVYF